MEGKKNFLDFSRVFRNLVRKKGSYLMLATLDSSERVFRNANKKHPEFRQPNKKRSSFSVILRYELS